MATDKRDETPAELSPDVPEEDRVEGWDWLNSPGDAPF